MALSVRPIRKYTGKLVVKPNYGMQGSKYNPQKPAPAKHVQQSAPATTVQRTYNPQPAYSTPYTPAPVVNAAAVRAAAEARQRAIQAAIKAQREREAKRKYDAAKLKVGNLTTKNKNKLLKVSKTAQHQGALRVRQPDAPEIKVNADRFDQKKYQAYLRAKAIVEQHRQGKKGISKFWGNLTGAHRGYSEEQMQKVFDEDISDYESTLGIFLDEQAKRKAAIEKAKFGSQEEFNRAVAEFENWENSQIQTLEDRRADITGLLEGFQMKASEPLKGTPGRLASYTMKQLKENPVSQAAGKIWKYTLGEGDRNIPSLVTAPSRAINFLGNLNTNNRNIYKYGGETANRVGSGDNAWQATHNQRNFNIRPWVDRQFDLNEAKQKWSKDLYNQRFRNNKDKPSYEQWLEGNWAREQQGNRLQNSALEIAADPLNIAAGAGAVAKWANKGGKITSALGATRAGRWAGKTVGKTSEIVSGLKSKAAQNSVLKWLGSEATTPQERISEAIRIATAESREAQNAILDRVLQLNKKLSKNEQLDVNIFDDLARLTDSEVKTLQRMVGGKLAARDRLLLSGKGMEPVRQKLEGIAQRWTDFTEKMLKADNVEVTRFGRGKKLYAPYTTWADGDLEKYNFLKKRNRKSLLNKDEFNVGAVDRYFKSSIDEGFAGAQTAKQNRWLSERNELLSRYDDTVSGHKTEITRLKKKANSPLNKTRSALGAPVRAWKKSVLKYRPAWTVNNVLYNTQAAALAGGPTALLEQAKLLNPRYWRRAMDEVPNAVKTNLAKEIGGKGKLDKFYNNVENWSRIAGYRGARRKGYSEADALKRVDKYLFDYSTKNWERPIKAVVPFWAFQKNLAKAAVNMPFDQPQAAIAYNRVGRYQDQQFDNEFKDVVPELKELGYTDEQIEQIKQEQAKYFKGRLKVGNKWLTTPFNAFSEKGMTNAGINPYLAAAQETADSVNSWGQTVSGEDATLPSRLRSKFPHAELADTAVRSFLVDRGILKPTERWIGEKGTSGYGLTKEKQGFDKSKPNYVRGMDPRAGFKQDALAFLGVPRGLEFDKGKLIETKKFQKVTGEYFATDWGAMEYPEAEAKRKQLFDKYGTTADEFFKGILAKYDSDQTKQIKGKKEAAAAKNKNLFDEYAAQPEGTRNLWATRKLKQLNAEGYFDKNPFLKSFEWIDPSTVGKAQRQEDYQYASSTGDWSKWESKYGVSEKKQLWREAMKTGDWSKWVARYGKSEKARAYQQAQETGDWSAYNQKYGKTEKATAYEQAQQSGDWTGYNSKYGKTEKAVAYEKATKTGDWLEYRKKYGDTRSGDQKAKAEAAKFWQKYYDTPKGAKRDALLAANPKFNKRADWTDEQWDRWKADRKKQNFANLKKSERRKLIFEKHLAANRRDADKFLTQQINKRIASRLPKYS